MAFHYEVTVDALLAGMFRERFRETLEKAGFTVVLELASPERHYILGLRRGKDSVTLSVAGQLGQKMRTVTISSETFDLSDLISETIKTLARELVVSFLVPLSEIPPEELEARMKVYLCDIDEDIYP
jgi:hypothetical protein